MDFLMADHIERALFEHVCIICRDFFPSRGIKSKHILERHKLLPCLVCPVILRNQEDFREHHEQHGLFPCTQCNALWPTMEEMEYHVSKFHAISCKECDEEFPTEETREKHILADHFFKCKICIGIFQTIKARDEHTQKFHSIVCNMCKNTFKTDEGRQMHFAATHSFKCIVCDGIWPTSVARKDHVAKFHPEDENTPVVNDASNLEIDISHSNASIARRSKSAENLKKNQFFDAGVVRDAKKINESFLQTENDEPSASKCKADSNKKQSFEVQFKRAKKDDKNTSKLEQEQPSTSCETKASASKQCMYTCELCHLHFETEQKQDFHMNFVHKWNCPGCDKVFKTEVNRNQHLNLMHLIECEICKKICTSEEMYLIHVKMMHQFSK